MSDHISVIDLTELLLQDAKEPVWERTANIFYKAMNSIGFVYLSGHGISKEKVCHTIDLQSLKFRCFYCFHILVDSKCIRSLQEVF